MFDLQGRVHLQEGVLSLFEVIEDDGFRKFAVPLLVHIQDLTEHIVIDELIILRGRINNAGGEGDYRRRHLKAGADGTWE